MGKNSKNILLFRHLRWFRWLYYSHIATYILGIDSKTPSYHNCVHVSILGICTKWWWFSPRIYSDYITHTQTHTHTHTHIYIYIYIHIYIYIYIYIYIVFIGSVFLFDLYLSNRHYPYSVCTKIVYKELNLVLVDGTIILFFCLSCILVVPGVWYFSFGVKFWCNRLNFTVLIMSSLCVCVCVCVCVCGETEKTGF